MYTPKGKYRIELRLADGKVVRVSVKKRHGDGGKYVPLEHPWKEKDLAHLKKGREVMNLLARGISDFDDAMRKVNKPRRSRRNSQKKPASNGLYAPMSPV